MLIKDYDLQLTMDHSQYFPGAATEKYDLCVVGAGLTVEEAIEDSIEQLAMRIDIPNIQLDTLEEGLKAEFEYEIQNEEEVEPTEDPDEENDIFWFAALRVIVEDTED